MTVIPSHSEMLIESGVVKIPQYAHILSMIECEIFGVKNSSPSYSVSSGCKTMWSKAERDTIQRYLDEAQIEIEEEIGYPLSLQWYTDEVYTLPFPQSSANKLKLKRGYFVAGGTKATATIQAGVAVSHVADPAVVAAIALTTAYDLDEIHVYHPGTDIEIHPDTMSIAGLTLNITIPRCRMVKTALQDNPPTGLEYSDTTNFESTVDVKRVYNDTTIQAEFFRRNSCGEGEDCSETTAQGCIYADDPQLGIVTVQQNSNSCGCYDSVRLNYCAGYHDVTTQMEDAIIRLAHSKMPGAPCGCEYATRRWTADRDKPQVLTAERINCRFGVSDGAWIAFMFAQAMKLWRGSNI